MVNVDIISDDLDYYGTVDIPGNKKNPPVYLGVTAHWESGEISGEEPHWTVILNESKRQELKEELEELLDSF